jgi:hypothetical protein
MRVSNNAVSRERADLGFDASVCLDLVAMGGRRCTRESVGWFTFEQIR